MWGRPVVDVGVYGSGGFTTYDDRRLHQQLESWLDLGLDLAKIKVGESRGTRERRDLERASTACRTLGSDCTLMVDANGAYDRGQAVRVGSALDDLGVVWFEEPVSSQDVDGLALVRDRVTADVAAGEYASDEREAARLAGAVDCVQLDVTRCGGYTGWMRAAAAVTATQLPVSGHCAPAVTTPVAAVTGGLRHLEWFHDHVRIESAYLDGAASPVDGALAVRDAPGHGLTPRWADLEEHRVR